MRTRIATHLRSLHRSRGFDGHPYPCLINEGALVVVGRMRPMNLAFTVSVVAAVVAGVVALLCLGFGTAPGWRHHRRFAPVAGSAALYCLTDAFSTLAISETTMLAVMRVQGAGMEFYAELLEAAPAMVERVVVISGGAFTPTARAFLKGYRTCVSRNRSAPRACVP